jgi:hypothetical protein
MQRWKRCSPQTLIIRNCTEALHPTLIIRSYTEALLHPELEMIRTEQGGWT